MLNGILAHLVLGYVVSMLGQVGASFNWTALKSEIHGKLKALIPWSAIEAEAEKLVDTIIGACATVLQDSDVLKELMADVINKKYDAAVDALRQLLVDAWKPASPDGKAVLAFLDGEELKFPEPPAPAVKPMSVAAAQAKAAGAPAPTVPDPSLTPAPAAS